MSRMATMLALLLGGCAHGRDDLVTVRMETGYSMLSGIAGAQRVWLVHRWRSPTAGLLVRGEAIIASLDCSGTNCSIAGIRLATDPHPANAALELRGRIASVSTDQNEAIVLVAPTPVDVSAEVYEELKHRPGRITLVEVDYVQSESDLEFKELRPAGTVTGQAIRWK